MDSKNGGPSSEERQRQAAIEIARRKVLTSYGDTATNESNTGEHLKDSAVQAGGMTLEQWKKYHSAWQNYYQKYYSEYYSNAAKQYVATQKLKAERAAAEDEESRSKVDDKEFLTKFKDKIKKRASDEAKRSRKNRKWIPIVAGIAVTVTILFLQYNRLVFAPLAAYVSPGATPSDEITEIDPTVQVQISDETKLIIPKLNINVPIILGSNYDNIMAAMNSGVAHYSIAGANALPGQIGNFIVTGHSAGDVYSNNQYKFIFSGLERLSEGDLIYVNYESTRYIYKMIGSKVVEPTDVQSLVLDTDKPMITLVTCTPLGTSRYRLLIFAEQISPSYDNAPESEPIKVAPEVEMPSNEPSFFEKIWNWITGKE